MHSEMMSFLINDTIDIDTLNSDIKIEDEGMEEEHWL